MPTVANLTRSFLCYSSYCASAIVTSIFSSTNLASIGGWRERIQATIRLTSFLSRILGHALLEDPHYPTRIVAADTLREIGTSMKDIRAFWPEHTPDKVVSGFPYADLADSSWLRGLVDLLRRLDSHRQFAKNRSGAPTETARPC